ncbi:hypothetical protein HY546_02260 [archaeon]|nr:hypothetical protein [archaeon]
MLPALRAQSAMEYVVILAVMLLVLFPLIYIANVQSEASAVAVQGRQAADLVISSADRVYALGPGSKVTRLVFIPEGYSPEDSFVNGKVVSMVFFLSDGTNATISLASVAELRGSLPQTAGLHAMQFSTTEGGYVTIGTAKLTASPGSVSLLLAVGEQDTKTITFTNIYTSPLAVLLTLNGPSWLSVNQTSLSLPVGSSASVALSASPTSAGSFSASLDASDAATGEKIGLVPVSVLVSSPAGSLAFSTNNNSYTQNDTLNYTGRLVDAGGTPISGALVSINFYDNTSALQSATSKITNSSGEFSGSYTFAQDAPIGWWSASVSTSSLTNSSYFYLNGTDLVAPPAVALSLPANGSVNVSRTPTLSWNAVTDPSQPVVYILNVDDNSNFASIEVNTTTTNTSYAVTTTLQKNKVHYWRVRAKDSAQNMGSWSEVWNFRTVNQ